MVHHLRARLVRTHNSTSSLHILQYFVSDWLSVPRVRACVIWQQRRESLCVFDTRVRFDYAKFVCARASFMGGAEAANECLCGRDIV